MVSRRRRGRPSAQLPAAAHPVTLRVRELVREVHGGNLREAARHAGLPYATLRELHRGETANPGMATLARLSGAYGIPMDWFLAAAGGDKPKVGWVGILPPDPETGADPRYARRVVIPFGAWSLVSVAMRLERFLARTPPTAHRPIAGGATDEFDVRRRLTAFLLQPLLSARAAGAVVPLPAEPPLRGEPPLTPERREQWLTLLRRLGDYWEQALGELLR